MLQQVSQDLLLYVWLKRQEASIMYASVARNYTNYFQYRVLCREFVKQRSSVATG